MHAFWGVPMKMVIGYAWVFDNAVVFGDFSDLLSVTAGRGRRKFGELIGVVKGLIPQDPYHVIYFYYKHSKAYLQRQKLRKLRRKLGIKRTELRYLQPLTKFL